MLLVSGGSATVARLGASPQLGILLVPGAGNVPQPGFAWALDNGAFAGFNAKAFVGMLARHAARASGALWCACPDVVSDADATRALWLEWAPRIRAAGYRAAYVVQDGETPQRAPWDCDAIFIGGSTHWKLSGEARALVAEAKRRSKAVHMGRVNTYQRIRAAHAWGVDTIDGTSFSKWPDRWIPWALAKLRNLDKQGAMPWA